MSADDSVLASAPFYLMRARTPCWKCSTPTTVVGLAAETAVFDGQTYGQRSMPPAPVSLTNIVDMPYDLLQVVRAYLPGYRKHESKTTSADACFQNECSACGAVLRDHYLFAEPEGAFFPMTEEDARTVEVFQLPLVGTLEIDAEFGEGGTDIIFACWARH